MKSMQQYKVQDLQMMSVVSGWGSLWRSVNKKISCSSLLPLNIRWIREGITTIKTLLENKRMEDSYQLLVHMISCWAGSGRSPALWVGKVLVQILILLSSWNSLFYLVHPLGGSSMSYIPWLHLKRTFGSLFFMRAVQLSQPAFCLCKHEVLRLF